MADFVAVIRRTVDGLSDNVPEMRAKVYDKARGAVRRQLENMKPRPSDEMIERQMGKLEAAITEVESEHAEALPPLEDEPVANVVEPTPEPVAAEVEPVAAEPESEPEHVPFAHETPAQDVIEPQSNVAPLLDEQQHESQIRDDDFSNEDRYVPPVEAGGPFGEYMSEPAAPDVPDREDNIPTEKPQPDGAAHAVEEEPDWQPTAPDDYAPLPQQEPIAEQEQHDDAGNTERDAFQPASSSPFQQTEELYEAPSRRESVVLTDRASDDEPRDRQPESNLIEEVFEPVTSEVKPEEPSRDTQWELPEWNTEPVKATGHSEEVWQEPVDKVTVSEDVPDLTDYEPVETVTPLHADERREPSHNWDLDDDDPFKQVSATDSQKQSTLR